MCRRTRVDRSGLAMRKRAIGAVAIGVVAFGFGGAAWGASRPGLWEVRIDAALGRIVSSHSDD